MPNRIKYIRTATLQKTPLGEELNDALPAVSSENNGDFLRVVNGTWDVATVPAAVTESTVSGWGFTKNTGTYSKPSGGIPKTDLASDVQMSLGKADTALQEAPVTSVNGQTGDVVIEANESVAETDFPSISDIAELWNSVSNLPAGAWEDYAWHQCPEAVRNYLANVDYTGVAYTESSVGTYAPTPAVPATNTKPIGQTVDGVTFYNIRPNSNAPYATANKSGVLNPLDQVRWIKSSTSNFRDLGGWPCDGGTVKYGLLYRSGNLNAADEDLILNQLGITVECDLTADGEPAYPDKMRFIGYTSYAMYTLANTGAWQTNLRGIFGAVKCGDPVVFHCSMGADRTGTLACILEGLLGVSQSDIDKDYELTSFYAERARNGNYQGGTTDWAHLIAQILALSGDSFRDKCVTFVQSLGFTVAEINEYRRAMIDGDPEDIETPGTTYTVTNNLTNCSTNNSSSSADGGGVYAATITANSGYTLTGATVSITMGGTDITSSAYNGGTISIASVIGNIVIQISATQSPSYTNQIPISTDANGNVFNTTGYKEGYRLNSSGAETAISGYVVTGFMPFVLGQEIIFDKFSGSETSNGGIYYFDSNHNIIATNKVNTLITDGILTAGQILDYTPESPTHNSNNGNMTSIENVAYIRISVQSSSPASLICGILGGTPQELFDPSAATINQRFSSSGAYSAQNGNFCTDYIAVSGINASEPWRIHIKDTTDATRFRANASYESVLFCKSDKSVISGNYGRLAVQPISASNTLMKHNDSNGGVYIDINQTGDGNYIPSTFFDLSQVAYIRICMAYSSGTAIPGNATLANISITADKITN